MKGMNMNTESDYPREMKDLPPVNEEIVNLEGQEFYDISEWAVSPFHELPDGQGEASQVHLWINLAGAEDLPLVVRFKSARSVDQFIGALRRHRIEVWGDSDV